jgi:hypothetical protein
MKISRIKSSLCALLIAASGFSVHGGTESGLVFSPERPILDVTATGGEVEVGLDLSPEIKAQLKGRGTILLNISVSPQLQVRRGLPVRIDYNGPVTTVRNRFVLGKNPAAPREPGEFAEYFLIASGEEKLGLGTVSPVWFPDGRIITRSLVTGTQVLVRGPYYPAVKAYLSRRPATAAWDDTSTIDGVSALVRYLVPASALDTWLPLLDRPEDVAAAHQLGLSPSYLVGWDSRDLVNPFGAFNLREAGWPSSAAYWAQLQDYNSSVQPVEGNFAFSFGERVPPKEFLRLLDTLPSDLVTGERDYEIANRYQRDEGTKNLTALGLNATEILDAFQRDYLFEDFYPVNPTVLGVMGQTYADPTWRADAPLAVVVMSREVSEGTFSENRVLARLAKTHRLVVGQANTSDDLLKITSSAIKRHGLADVLVLSGHGNSTFAAVLGIEPATFAALSGTLHPQATIILSACSTGEWVPGDVNVAAALRDALPGRTVIAATALINGAYVNYLPDTPTRADRYRVFMMGSGLLQAQPMIITPDRIRLRQGRATTIRLTATSAPQRYVASNLPVGLKLNTTTGVIYGVPRRAGSFAVTIQAINSGGTGKKTIQLQVAAVRQAFPR